MAERHAVVVGAGEPADPIAAGLADREWTVARRLPEAGPVDLLVHADYPAITRRRADLVTLDDAQWREAVDAPLADTIRLLQQAHARLAEVGGTAVFLVPLMASAGGEGFAPFATVAEGVRLLAKSLAKTWGGDGIRAHALTLDPGAFLDPDDAAGIAEANALHDPPLGRVPDPRREVGRVVEVLAGPDLASLTGASLVVDGGLWMPG